MTKSRGGWHRWLLRGALTLHGRVDVSERFDVQAAIAVLSHGDLAPVHAARHAAVDSIAEIARAGVNRVCVWSSLLRSEIPKSASTAWPSETTRLSGLKSRTGSRGSLQTPQRLTVSSGFGSCTLNRRENARHTTRSANASGAWQGHTDHAPGHHSYDRVADNCRRPRTPIHIPRNRPVH